ncbi:GNAT family N-acetyltransferase [Rhodobacter ferrooxidans]|uniref:BioF2-like acetyltransferase domain-containing protein n=1 Tax=Rhodobacter ferrooxidans TaxID=371731 RepID=C8S495_9RHOB|nr:GNAT family N-acetyltransferase [Rhodobacter sp. SW2]EEW24154.1 hypothetical protein Rsw2DRAFT_2873 [Rhodobacter sp. SW2]
MTPEPMPAHLRPMGSLPQPLGWPRTPLQGSPVFLDLWHGFFGKGLRRRVIETQGPDAARLDLVSDLARRRLALGTRFQFCPADLPLVANPERRLIPLRQLSCPMSLEAGNLRGNLQMAAGADPQRAIAGLAEALAQNGGWDYLALPVPRSETARWRAAAGDRGMPMILRPTGRTFHACIGAQANWERLRSACSHNERKNERRALRRAAEADLRLTVHEGDAAVAALPLLRWLADRSTKALRPSDAPVQVPYSARQEAFLRSAIQLPGYSGVLIAAENAAGLLAATLWLKRGNEILGLITFHIEAARPLSPGLLLMRESFLWAEAKGVERLDFNATDPLYRAYSDVTEAWFDLLLFPTGISGRMLHRLACARDPGIGLSAASAP